MGNTITSAASTTNSATSTTTCVRAITPPSHHHQPPRTLAMSAKLWPWLKNVVMAAGSRVTNTKGMRKHPSGTTV
jgi:hypothetical protein